MSVEAVYQAVLEGDAGEAAAQVQAALDAGTAPGQILNNGCIVSEWDNRFIASRHCLDGWRARPGTGCAGISIPADIYLMFWKSNCSPPQNS